MYGINQKLEKEIDNQKWLISTMQFNIDMLEVRIEHLTEEINYFKELFPSEYNQVRQILKTKYPKKCKTAETFLKYLENKRNT